MIRILKSISLFLKIICFILEANAQSKNTFLTIKADSISFISKPSEYKIAGTLSYPLNKKTCPAIVLVAGSGPHTREEIISGTPIFSEMATYFNQLGYAVIRIDKRGYGLSEGSNSVDSVTTAQLSEDILGAIQFLKKHNKIDASNIGIIGHSEGAWIAEMIALKDTSVKWLVLLGAHAVSGAIIQEDQMTANLLRRGAEKEVVEKVRPQIKRIIDFVVNDNLNDSIFFAIGKDFLLGHGMKEENITKKLINQLLDGFRSPWNRYFFGHSPANQISLLKIPTLFIYGSKDKQVDPELNIGPLIEIMKSYERNNMTLNILSDHDHFFLHYSGKSLEKHKFGEMHVSKIMLDTIKNWLLLN